MKNRGWIIIFASALIICAVWWLCITAFSSPAKTVGIYQNGELIEKIDLTTVTGEREIELSGEYGSNIVYISNGSIKMKSADCPDKICVKHGELESAGSPIVCLPNKVIIKFEAASEKIDAKAGAAG